MLLIPLWIRQASTKLPLITYILLFINIAVFLVSPLTGSFFGDTSSGQVFCEINHYFSRWGVIAQEIWTGHVLDAVPGLPPEGGPQSCPLSAPDYFKVPLLSILTAMFVHASWLHLIPNMIFLLVFGEKVENILGRVKYLGLYFASGILATLASVLLAGQYDTVPLVGASGAIAGILGAYLVMCPLKRVVGLCVPLFFIPLILPAWIVLGTWILAQWLYAAGAGLTAGATSGYVAHVFGFTYVGALYAAATGRSSWEEKQKPVEPIALEDDVIWPPAPGNLKWPMWLAIAGIFLGPVPGLIALIWSLNIWWDCKRYHAQTRKALNIIVLSAFSVLAGSVQGVVVVTLLRNLF